MARHGTAVLGDRAIRGMFFERLVAATGIGWLDQISNLFDSDQDMETYKWLGQSPQLKLWLDGKSVKQLRNEGIEIVNDEYESTIGIPLSDLRRDKTGQLRIRMADMVRRSQSHWASLVSTLIVNGEGAASYDGANFFSVNHVEGDSGTQSNLLTASDYDQLNVGTAAQPTAAELVDVIMVMVQHLLTFKDDQAEPRNEDAMQFIAMVPITMWGAAQKAMHSNSLAVSGGGNQDNILLDSPEFSVSAVANPRLSWGGTKLAVFRADNEAKAFIRQEEVPITPKILGADSEHAFKNGEALFSLEASRAAGYGMWWQAVKATLS